MADFRALCAELVDAIDSGISTDRMHLSPLMLRARAALAQPEPNDNGDLHSGSCLRDARRPKAPSLKEQAFKILNPEKEGVLCGTFEYRVSTLEAATIRRALEALPDD